MNSTVKLFLDKLSKAKKDKHHSYYSRAWDEEVALNALLSFDKPSVKKIVSDPYWNRYPMWSTSFNKLYGPAISIVVRTASSQYPTLMNYITDYGVGIWLCFAIDNAHGKLRIKAAKRALCSPDVRARKRGASTVPVSFLKRHINNPDASVRQIALKRIGIDNCYEQLLEDANRWIRVSAIQSAPLELFDYKEALESSLKSISEEKVSHGWGSWKERAIAASILSKMNKKELLYALNIIGCHNDLAKIVSSRLSSDWG